jgi:hypothetical protein
MSKPLNHKLLHVALLVIEFALLWILLTLLVQPDAPVSTLLPLGVILVFFIFTAHLTAIALQVIVPKFAVERHTFAITVSILGAILLAVVLSSGIIIGMSYLSSGL